MSQSCAALPALARGHVGQVVFLQSCPQVACLSSLTIRLLLQATNGGGAFSDYSSSVPSTPSISQRELRIETIAASNTPTPIRKQSKRRSNIFTVSTTGSQSSGMGLQHTRGEGRGSGQPEPTGCPARQPVLYWQEGRGLQERSCVWEGPSVCAGTVVLQLLQAECACMRSIWEQDVPRTPRSVQGCTRVGVRCV